MNRDITSIYKAYARSNRLHPILLVSATFDSGTLRFWNGYSTLSYDGNDYTGAGDLLNITSSAETEELKANGISVGLSGISSEIISTALNQPVAGRPIDIKMGFLSGDPQEILTYNISVSSGLYYIEQEQTPKIYVIRGQTYKFDQSNSTNATHNLRISRTSDGTHGGGVQYTDGFTEVGTAGSAGAYNQWVVPKLSTATTNYTVKVVSNGQLYNSTGYTSSNYGNVFQLNNLRTQDIDSGKTVTYTNAQGSITGNTTSEGSGDSSRSSVSLFVATVTLSSSYTQASGIWEIGGTYQGAWIGISKQSNSYFLRCRGGDGSTSVNTANTNCAIAQVSVSSLSHFFDGNSHELAWELDPANGRSVIWIDGTIVALGFTTDNSDMLGGYYAGAAAGGFISGLESANIAGGTTDSGGTQYQSAANYTGGATGSLSHYDNQYANQSIVPIELEEGLTYRFTQSDSSNDGHPLFISQSNSSTLSEVQNNYVTDGVSYYIDGASTFSDYTNTTTFNAGTTRYIEFTPQTSGTFYIACYVHGIGMGFPLNIISNTTFYYYCQNHSGMGGEIGVSSDFVLFEPFTLFDGQMDKMEIQDNGETSNVSIVCESKLITLQTPRVRRYTLEDQKLDFPNDKGLEFIPSLQDKEITWGRG